MILRRRLEPVIRTLLSQCSLLAFIGVSGSVDVRGNPFREIENEDECAENLGPSWLATGNGSS